MSHTLDYFLDFLDNPDVYDNTQYSELLQEWVKFLEANKETIDFLGEDWTERRERLHRQYDERFNIAPEIKKELEEICLGLEKVKEMDDTEKIALYQRNLAFIKKHQKLYRISDEDIAVTQEKFDKFIQSVEVKLIAREKAEQAKIKADAALENFEQAIFDEYERTGKMPIITVDLRKGKHSGN